MSHVSISLMIIKVIKRGQKNTEYINFFLIQLFLGLYASHVLSVFELFFAIVLIAYWTKVSYKAGVNFAFRTIFWVGL